MNPDARALYNEVESHGGIDKPTVAQLNAAVRVANRNEFDYVTLLLRRITLGCYDSCVTVPGSQVSKLENTCLKKCVDRRIESQLIVNHEVHHQESQQVEQSRRKLLIDEVLDAEEVLQ
eukprot:TRINITY_DN10845_c0_g1_i1.p1 TRINITY_DN10845_c0_g1~~TRINITY_DN10845_c0_g1_i1.p1  ORF type:complete len:132 (+),score=23.67 TRINITY_DN10845_c0_g1_i1:41-397(+)